MKVALKLIYKQNSEAVLPTFKSRIIERVLFLASLHVLLEDQMLTCKKKQHIKK